MEDKERLEQAALNVMRYEPSIMEGCKLIRKDYRAFLNRLEGGSVDLVLTDPPYAISRETGFANGNVKIERFAVSMDFGDWDYNEIDLGALAEGAYNALRKGGTAIIWYDLWKITKLRDAMKSAGFNMLRAIIWQKTNPVPLNSKKTYLSNSREIAIVGVKGGNPTFNSEYDNGIYRNNDDDIIYEAPIPRHNGNRIHPTQKSLNVSMDIIAKHSNDNDLIVDPFCGSGTTAIAALKQGRRFAGCDIDYNYVNKAQKRIRNEFK